MNPKRLASWHIGIFLLALVGAVFHLWQAEAMHFLSPIGEYFGASGVLFLVGGIIAILGGRGFLFKLGAGGVLALSAIDNGLLYYTRTFGLGFIFGLFPPPRSFQVRTFNGTLGGGFNGTASRVINGTFRARPPGGGAPWSTSWFPPGAVQFFVLQTVIIIVCAVALWRVSGPKELGARPGETITDSAPSPP
jgi:hypothetical protein